MYYEFQVIPLPSAHTRPVHQPQHLQEPTNPTFPHRAPAGAPPLFLTLSSTRGTARIKDWRAASSRRGRRSRLAYLLCKNLLGIVFANLTLCYNPYNFS